MSDNPITPIPANLAIAADDVGGVLHPRTKIEFGADGSATDVSPANPLPVTSTAGPSSVYVPVTLGSGDLASGACRAIVVEVAGRVNLKQPNGTTRANYPLFAGINPIGALMIDAPTSGTPASGIWALY